MQTSIIKSPFVGTFMKFLVFTFFLIFSSSAFAAPSCSALRTAWDELNRRVKVHGWDGPFSCPSQQANVATAFYYLKELEIRDSSGNEKFNYYDYVMDSLEYVIKRTKPESTAVRTIINFGSGFYATHDADGKALRNLGVEAPAMLVHERKHMDIGNVKHVQCKLSDDNKRYCDAQFFDLYAGEADWHDPKVGAYSASVAYFTDVILHSKGNGMIVSGAKFQIKHFLKNYFMPRSAEYPNGITKKQISDVLKRVNSQ